MICVVFPHGFYGAFLPQIQVRCLMAEKRSLFLRVTTELACVDRGKFDEFRKQADR